MAAHDVESSALPAERPVDGVKIETQGARLPGRLHLIALGNERQLSIILLAAIEDSTARRQRARRNDDNGPTRNGKGSPPTREPTAKLPAMLCQRALLICIAWTAPACAWAEPNPQEIGIALAAPLAVEREAALDRLIETHDGRSELLPMLTTLLADTDLDVAGKAALVLGQMGTAAFPAIREALASNSMQQRWGATVALYRSSADIEPFLTVLTQQLSEPDALLVRASLGALTRLQSRAAVAVPALQALLKHKDADLRWGALETLAAIGPGAHEAVSDIEPVLRDQSVQLRLAAADALRRISPPAALSEARLAAHVAWLKENVPKLMRETHVPGVSIAIMQHGEVSWTGGFGVSDVRTGREVTTRTAFEACSMSKPVLALIAMQLVQEGRLELDRPLVAYLGHDYLPDQPEHRLITARMALTHRTGLANWREGYDAMGGPLALEFPPGSQYTYSGEGFLFLQRAIEAIAGQPLDRLADQRLFAPLGLVRTSFVWTEAIERDLASGHREDGSYKERTHYRKPNAAYSLYTTPTEYARLMLTLGSPELLGDRALTRATLDQLLQRQLRVDDGDAIARPGRARSIATYRALGWSLDVTSEGDIVEHSGSNSSGFRSFGQFNPTKGSGLVIFTNAEGGYNLRARIIAAIGDL
jgi:CubicO group peptidase (beta-lactamase class C family)